MRIRPLITAVLLSAAVVPASASAATTIGSSLVGNATQQAPPGDCMMGPCTYLQTDASTPAVAQYVVPPSIVHGVITSWSFKASSGGDALQVLRPQPNGTYVDVGDSAPEPAAGGNTIATFATRLPVQAGDAIGLFNNSNALVIGHTTSAANVVHEFDPFVGATPATPSSSTDHSELELQATVENDADDDGFGDETQDQCPIDPLLQTACAADLQVSATGTAKLQAGQIASYSMTVHNAGSSPAVNATIVLNLPAAVRTSSLSTSVGSCGAGFCALGTLANGASATITFSVATTAPGTFTAAATAQSGFADPNPADNAAGVTTTVEPADLALSGLAVFPKIFHRGNALPHLSPTAKAKPSAIKFTLSEAATVKLSIAQIGRHNHVGTAQSFSIKAPAGDNRLIFSGVLPNHHQLKAGEYRLTASAATSDGRRANAAAVRFTVHLAR
jgi:uncharacterized repeat protein (TIGR01451 family)